MSAGARIAVIEDDTQMMRFLRTGLEAHGFLPLEAGTVREGLACIVTHRPDLVLLDLALPDGDGIRVIEEVRGWSQMPILVLSSRSAATEKIAALDKGANDYVTKPFDIGELLARIRAALRSGREEEGKNEVIATGPLRMDLVRRLVTLRGEDLHLSPREYDLLKLLATNAGMVLTHSILLTQVWGDDQVESAYLRIFVSRLRHKIETDPARPQLLLTETGIGYRLKLLPTE